jgi:hypothetical protein
MNTKAKHINAAVPVTQEAGGHISYRVSHFDSLRHTGEEIAQTHLAVRQWQTDVQGVVLMNPGKS